MPSSSKNLTNAISLLPTLRGATTSMKCDPRNLRDGRDKYFPCYSTVI